MHVCNHVIELITFIRTYNTEAPWQLYFMHEMALGVAMESDFQALVAILDNTTQYIFVYVMLYINGMECEIIREC